MLSATRLWGIFDMCQSGSACPVGDTPLGKIIGCELDGDPIPAQNSNVVFTHLSGDMSVDNMSIIEFNSKLCVGQGFQHRAFHFNVFFFGHSSAYAS